MFGRGDLTWKASIGEIGMVSPDLPGTARPGTTRIRLGPLGLACHHQAFRDRVAGTGPEWAVAETVTLVSVRSVCERARDKLDDWTGANVEGRLSRPDGMVLHHCDQDRTGMYGELQMTLADICLKSWLFEFAAGPSEFDSLVQHETLNRCPHRDGLQIAYVVCNRGIEYVRVLSPACMTTQQQLAMKEWILDSLDSTVNRYTCDMSIRALRTWNELYALLSPGESIRKYFSELVFPIPASSIALAQGQISVRCACGTTHPLPNESALQDVIICSCGRRQSGKLGLKQSQQVKTQRMLREWNEIFGYLLGRRCAAGECRVPRWPWSDGWIRVPLDNGRKYSLRWCCPKCGERELGVFTAGLKEYRPLNEREHSELKGAVACPGVALTDSGGQYASDYRLGTIKAYLNRSGPFIDITLLQQITRIQDFNGFYWGGYVHDISGDWINTEKKPVLMGRECELVRTSAAEMIRLAKFLARHGTYFVHTAATPVPRANDRRRKTA